MSSTEQEQVSVLVPGATLGVLGGGQLGRMFVTAARTMGFEVVVLDPNPESPAGSMASHQIVADYGDQSAWAELAKRCSAVTCEFENVPAAALAWLKDQGIPVAPGAIGVYAAQNRIDEKQAVMAAGYAVAPFVPILDSGVGLDAAGSHTYPAILKSARLGYDGKGQVQVRSAEELRSAWESLGRVDCVLEQRLNLAKEVSVIVVRGRNGETRSYPCIENRHRDGILDESCVPASIAPELDQKARQAACAIASHLDYQGVLTVEFFLDKAGELYVNEMAPRPHNSGHLSINAAHCSQFEQQVRVMCGLPLGPCEWHCPSAMINLLGDLWSPTAPDFASVLAIPGCSLHLYGKSEARDGRKMGHVTVVAPDLSKLRERVAQARAHLGLAAS